MRFLFAFLLISPFCFAQVTSKTIVVEGHAKANVSPDLATVSLNVEQRDTSQAKAMSKVNQLVEGLAQLLMRQGVPKRQIKIADYRIHSENESKSKGVDYIVYNSLNVTLAMNGKQVNEILKNIAAQRMNGVEVSFEFGLSDSLEQATRNQLTMKAIADAQTRAGEISRALNLPLKGVLQVSKRGVELPQLSSLGEVYKPRVIEEVKGFVFNSAFGNFDVEAKELSEEIVIVYETGS